MKTLLTVLLISTALTIQAQKDTTDYDHTPVVSDKVFMIVEQMPEYPGGEKALQELIQKNINYPDDARSIGIQGRVVLGFIINEDGSIEGISIKKGVWPSMDAEALRVAHLMSRFTPGRQQGKAVRVQFIIPIMMKLGTNDMLGLANPHPVNETEVKALAAYRNDNYPRALKLFAKVIEEYPDDNFAWHNLSLCKYYTGDQEGAYTIWRQLRDKNFHTADFLINKYCPRVQEGTK